MKNLQIKAINIEMTEAIEDYFREKMNSLDKYIDLSDESVECDARVSKIADNQSGDIFKAEVSLHTSGKNYGAESTKDNLYTAIDDVRESMARKITSHKDKQRSLFKKGASKAKDLLKGLIS
ncbi:ribosome-associated translation inhibitor RaiA [Patescibacteria group bacterium]|nr:ribosome-associated translation inhibitor RaiA [Patescibacteria group bacterium]